MLETALDFTGANTLSLVALAQKNKAVGEMAGWVKIMGCSAWIGSAGVIDIGQAHLRIDSVSF